MRKTVITMLLFEVACSHPKVIPDTHPTRSWSDVDQIVRQTIEPILDENFSIEVGIERSGETKFYHFSSHSEEAPPTEASIFGINSMTKVFTDLLLAQLVDEGKIKLDDPIEAYVGKMKVPSFEGTPITFRTLATQSSGLPFLPDNMGKISKTDPYANYTDGNLFNYLSHATLLSKPGTRYRYSNLAFGLLGCVLSKIEHRNFSEMIDERISKPLGLIDTHAFVEERTKERLVYGHNNRGKPIPPRSSSECMKGSWAIRSTAKDILRFLDFELQPEKSPFPKAFALTQEATQLEINKMNWIGFPWEIRKQSGSHGKGGAGGGFESMMLFNQNRNTAVVILSSSYPENPEKSPVAAAWKISTDLR